ncbi:MAG TPA: OmpA family protein [Polyangiaceae bacterium]|nr:OmpA family protein [Polyangiaceae bacterium]
MKNLAFLLALALPLTLIDCGGAQHRAADPRTGTDAVASANGDDPIASSNSDRQGSSGPSGSAQSTDASGPAVSAKSTDSSSPLNSAIRSQVRDEPGLSATEKASTSSDPESTASPKAENKKEAKRETGPTTVEQQDEGGPEQCRESTTGLTLSVDRKTVSLEEGHLRANMDGPICGLSLRITRKDGLPTIEKSFRYTAPEREMRWNPVPRDQIEKIEIRVSSKDGGYQSVFLIPWSVSIDHEEVQFDTNKAIIRDSEVTSLNDSLAKINDILALVEDKGLGTITLFIAGHTDTQGSNEHNMTLSRNRAQAIAAWFLKRGLCIPIAFEGFGETALKKLTADNVDEQANRRVDYILSVEAPTIKKGSAPAWKWISKGC